MSYRDSFLISLVLDGLKAILGTGVMQKVPLTLLELTKMNSLIPHEDKLGQASWGIIVFCFRTILRKSNVIPENNEWDDLLVRRSDLVFNDWGMIVWVTSTKTIKYKDQVLEIPICSIPGSKFCAVSLAKNHLSKFPAPRDYPIFLRKKGQKLVPIKYREMLDFLKMLSKNI